MKKKTLCIILVMSLLVVVFVPLSSVKAASGNSSRKTYPEVDTKLDTYKYVTEAPEIIYSTTAEENGLAGNCYSITGTVEGVYTSVKKALKGIGKTAEAKKYSSSEMKMKYIVVKTKKGKVIIADMYNYFYNLLKTLYGSDADLLKKSLKEIGFTQKKYKEYPENGEKVTILATYSGYSNLFELPILYYGINDGVVGMAKKESDDEKITEEEKVSEKFSGITFELPKSWDYKYVDDDGTHFYYPTEGMMFIQSYSGYSYLSQYLADDIYEAYTKGLKDLKLTASKTNDYNGKKIETFYIYSFNCTLDSVKYKGRITMFLYNKEVYLFTFVCPKNSSEYDNLFDAYTDIIKSIKTLK